jgi:hypothetical protein
MRERGRRSEETAAAAAAVMAEATKTPVRGNKENELDATKLLQW